MNFDREKVEELFMPAKKALRSLGHSALSILNSKFIPDFVMNDVHLLTPEMITKRSPSTQVVIFDIEGTLEPYESPVVSEPTKKLIKSLQNAGIVVVINSNADEERTKTVHEMFDDSIGTEFVITSYDTKKAGYKHGKKPYASMIELTEARVKQAHLPWNKQNFLMIGDQVFKDGFAGKNAHIKTLLVNKYGEGDHKGVALQRYPERWTMHTAGIRALGKTTSGYKPFELPNEMMRVREYRKKRLNASSPNNDNKTS